MKKTLLLVVFVAAGWAIFAGAQNPPEKAAPSEMLLTVLEDLKGVEEGMKKSAAAGVGRKGPGKVTWLKNRAEYLSGKITKKEFLQRSDDIARTLRAEYEARRKTGTVTSADLVDLADEIIRDHSLP